MVKQIALNVYGSKFRRFQKGGTRVYVNIERNDTKTNRSNSAELDYILFDMDDRKAGKPDRVVEAIRKSMNGEYEQEGCNKLGYVYSKGNCTNRKVAGTQTKLSEAKPQEMPELKTTIIKRK